MRAVVKVRGLYLNGFLSCAVTHFDHGSLCIPQSLDYSFRHPLKCKGSAMDLRHMRILLIFRLARMASCGCDVNAKDPDTVTSQHHSPCNAFASHNMYSGILLMIIL